VTLIRHISGASLVGDLPRKGFAGHDVAHMTKLIAALLLVPACAFVACASASDPFAEQAGESVDTVSAKDSPSPVDVLTQHNDNFRSGATLGETSLNVQSVGGPTSTFGLLGSLPVQDLVYAQPLYVHGVTLPDGHAHNVVYLADMQNNLFAYDADTLTLITRATLGAPERLPPHTFRNVNTTNGGIMATPVIDRANGVIYVNVLSAGPKFTLYALDLRTLVPVAHVDVANFSYPFPSGRASFDPATQFNRPGSSSMKAWSIWHSPGWRTTTQGIVVGSLDTLLAGTRSR